MPPRVHPLLQIMVDNEQIRAIKSEFFALRNGEIADRLRRAGSPYKIIFGLQLSQLDAMAARLHKSTELADALWQNTSTRESRLLAVLVYPLDSLTRQVAADMLAQADTRELVDLLCFKLVRNLPDAEVLVGELCTTDVYAALRLAMNLLCLQKLENLDSVYALAQAELANRESTCRIVARQVVDEIDFLRENDE